MKKIEEATIQQKELHKIKMKIEKATLRKSVAEAELAELKLKLFKRQNFE